MRVNKLTKYKNIKYIYVYVCVCIYVYMCVCVYIYIYIWWLMHKFCDSCSYNDLRVFSEPIIIAHRYWKLHGAPHIPSLYKCVNLHPLVSINSISSSSSYSLFQVARKWVLLWWITPFRLPGVRGITNPASTETTTWCSP